MKKENFVRRISAIMLVLAMVASLGCIRGIDSKAAAKKAKIDNYSKNIELLMNSHVKCAYNYASFAGFESIIENKKKNATYTIKIKNTKVAKLVKNSTTLEGYTDAHLIMAVGTGTTKGIVYEKKGKKKTKLGNITIKVKKSNISDAVYNAGSRDSFGFTGPLYLSPYMGQTTYDVAAMIHNFLNNKEYGTSVKKSEYSVEYELNYGSEGEEPIAAGTEPVTIDDKGLLTAHNPGEAYLAFTIKFNDGSDFSWNLTVNVIESSIKKEGKYSLDNIRDYIVGIDTQVPITRNGVESMATQICFDNAATTPAFKPVEDEVHDKLLMYGSIGRGFSEKSNYSTDLYNSTRNKVLDFLQADHNNYTCFYTNSTTDGLNKLASALITSKNDIVLTTRIEHHANDLSWRERCKVIYAEVDDKGRVKYSDIEKLLKKNKVKIVSVSAASNVTGYVSDVHKVAKLAHKYGAMIVADGAQIVAHRQFSMIGDANDPSDDIDFIAFSAHKMYSPYGGGAVVGKAKELYKHMPTFYGGGTVQIVADNWVHYKNNDVAVYEAGSPNYPGVVGLGKAIDVISDVGFDAIEAHEKALNRKLIDGLKKLYSNIILYGDSENIDDRVGVVTFNFPDVNTQLLAEKLSEIGAVATRRGQFCAHPYVWRLMNIPDSMLEGFEGCASSKTPGMVRVSFGIYNTEEEVDEFLKILPEAVEAAKEEQKKYDAVPEY